MCRVLAWRDNRRQSLRKRPGTGWPCLSVRSATAFACVIGDHAIELANRLFASRQRLDSSGSAAIPVGATVVPVVHGLVRDPRPEAIAVIAVRCAPGLLSIDSVGNGRFPLHCSTAAAGDRAARRCSAAIRQRFTTGVPRGGSSADSTRSRLVGSSGGYLRSFVRGTRRIARQVGKMPKAHGWAGAPALWRLQRSRWRAFRCGREAPDAAGGTTLQIRPD
jgi:hypothetical protein